MRYRTMSTSNQRTKVPRHADCTITAARPADGMLPLPPDDDDEEEEEEEEEEDEDEEENAAAFSLRAATTVSTGRSSRL